MPEVRERFVAQGAQPSGSTPDQFAAFIRAEDRQVDQGRQDFEREGGLRIAPPSFRCFAHGPPTHLTFSAEQALLSTTPRTQTVDTFARDHLPPKDEWPEFLFDRPEYRYPPQVNCVTELLDRHIEAEVERSLRSRP